MARYEREYRRYDREMRPRGARRYGGEYGRDYAGDYGGGWGMTGLYNTIMRGGPRGRGYGGDYPPRVSGPAPRWNPARGGYGRGPGPRPRYDRGWF